MRHIVNITPHEQINTQFKSPNLLKLTDCLKLNTATFADRVTKNLYIQVFFLFLKANSQRIQLPHMSEQLSLPPRYNSTTYCKEGLCYRAIFAWNSLSDISTTKRCLHSFVRHLSCCVSWLTSRTRGAHMYD